MKRGRRQIVNRNPFAGEDEEQDQNAQTINYQASQWAMNNRNLNQQEYVPQQQARVTENIWDTAIIYQKPQTKPQQTSVNQSTKVVSHEPSNVPISANQEKEPIKKQENIATQTDQKKKKLEMLKQKYLKKTPQTKNDEIDNKGKQTPISEPIANNEQVKFKNIQSTKPNQNSNSLQIRQIKSQQQDQYSNYATDQVKNTQPINQYQNPYKNTEQNMNNYQSPTNFFANLQTNQQQTNNYEEKPVQSELKTIPKQRIPPPPIQNKKGIPPPPVQKNNMKKIIQRKIQKYSTVPQQQVKQQPILQSDYKDPFNLKGQYYSKQLNQNQNTHDSNPSEQQEYVQQIKEEAVESTFQQNNQQNQINEQYENANYRSNYLHQQSTINVRNAYHSLLNRQYEQCLLNLNINFATSHILPSFQSKNKNCNTQTQLLLQALLFKNRQLLNPQQKQIVLDIASQFYYDNPTKLREIFVLILGKLGGQLLYPYKNSILGDFDRFVSILLSHHYLFLEEEINSVVIQSLLFIQPQQSSNIWKNEFIQLLALSPRNQKIVKRIYRSEATKIQNYLAILCIILRCQQTFTQDCNMLILKCINSIIDLSANENYQIGEGFLEFFNKLSFPQNLYQISKQIKVKIIKSISNNGNSPTINQPPKNNNNNGQTKNALLGFWNKAVDTIKTVNTLATSNKNNPPPPPPPEEKQEKITWDPELKRYRINGQIPPDEDGNKHTDNGTAQQKKKAPPPPPPIKGVPRAPPKKGNRVVGNRYS